MNPLRTSLHAHCSPRTAPRALHRAHRSASTAPRAPLHAHRSARTAPRAPLRAQRPAHTAPRAPPRAHCWPYEGWRQSVAPSHPSPNPLPSSSTRSVGVRKEMQTPRRTHNHDAAHACRTRSGPVGSLAAGPAWGQPPVLRPAAPGGPGPARSGPRPLVGPTAVTAGRPACFLMRWIKDSKFQSIAISAAEGTENKQNK